MAMLLRTLATARSLVRPAYCRAISSIPPTQQSQNNAIDTPDTTEHAHAALTKVLQTLTNREKSAKQKEPEPPVIRHQRTFAVGDTYRPEDLNDIQQGSRRQRRPTPNDPFRTLGLDPLKEYKNFMLLSSFVSELGKILPRDQTGLSSKHQRKLSKAVKRARAMGLIPCTHKLPAAVEKDSYRPRRSYVK
ncbi:mitochondrial 37S ribosomal protein bS18m [Calcarisporiella thermophila]|uniref:mitochondrial 37S ribosomal protein bS18m n=1 Tax=Calcarisporiella thermophila TaxID=911321 RepID=UPI003743561D